MNERDFSLAFSLAPGIGPKGFQKLLRQFGSAENAWKGSATQFKAVGIGKVNFGKFEEFRTEFDVNEYLSKLKKARVEFINFSDEHYPVALSKIDAPPIGLFVKGNKKLLVESNIIGVVGARKVTSYGSQVTSSLVSELCSAGFIIVSGMALGVDGVAHKSAIDARGSTIAVLGCGVDCPYPRENERLYEEILDSGGLIISEYPLGMPASPGTFPSRNRIIAGISSAVLITEAAEDSGSLITAEHAIEQGKTVFAVPGPITSQMSKGALKLLKNGAKLVQSVQDILDELEIKNTHSENSISKNKKFDNVTKEESKILKTLENENLTIDEISRVTKIQISKLTVVLSEMELTGLVKSSGGKFAIKNI